MTHGVRGFDDDTGLIYGRLVMYNMGVLLLLCRVVSGLALEWGYRTGVPVYMVVIMR
jgi:hypothetical protein